MEGELPLGGEISTQDDLASCVLGRGKRKHSFLWAGHVVQLLGTQEARNGYQGHRHNVRCYRPAILAPGRWRLEDWKFKVLFKNKIIGGINLLIVNFCITSLLAPFKNIYFCLIKIQLSHIISALLSPPHYPSQVLPSQIHALLFFNFVVTYTTVLLYIHRSVNE